MYLFITLMYNSISAAKYNVLKTSLHKKVKCMLYYLKIALLMWLILVLQITDSQNIVLNIVCVDLPHIYPILCSIYTHCVKCNF